MEESSKRLADWLDAVRDYEPAAWERLPELELYMDQVLTYMNRQLDPFTPDGERLLTPSMINNYVKDGVLARPVRKKYGREHLAMLMIICSLKSALSLPEIALILRGIEEGGVAARYPLFEQAHSDIMKEIAARIADAPSQDREALGALAVQLALEANARRIASARILRALEESSRSEKPEKPDKKDKDAHKEKDLPSES